ncbi:MAG: hypothetical protein M5U23_13800 [Acidimicrobiia bacterium]|nr:hypothetical protein [Acidimicrobiia bacterium]
MVGLEGFLQDAAEVLLDEHRVAREAALRKREAGRSARYHVEALIPIDVLGIYVLLPDQR